MIKKPIKETINLVSEKIVKTAAVLANSSQKESEGTMTVGKEFNLPREVYRKHLLSFQSGQLRELTLSSSRVILLSQYGAGLNLYKMLNVTRPDAVLLQVRGDDIFSKGFRIDVGEKEFEEGVRREAAEMMPSATHYYNTTMVLKKRGILTGGRKPEKVKQAPYMLVDRVHDYSIAYASRWGLHRGYSNYFTCDLPRESFTRRLLGSLTLLQLQNIFTSTCRMLTENPDIVLKHEPHSPLTAAYKIYPDLLVAPSDRFLSRFLLSVAPRFKTIFLILGNGQCETLPLFLSAIRDSPPPLESLLNPPWQYSALISSETAETSIEKRAIIDVSTFGLDLVSEIINHKALKRTQAFIDEVVMGEHKASDYTTPQQERVEKTNMLTMLYLSCLQKYKTRGVEEMKGGRESLKAEFMVALT